MFSSLGSVSDSLRIIAEVFCTAVGCWVQVFGHEQERTWTRRVCEAKGELKERAPSSAGVVSKEGAIED